MAMATRVSGSMGQKECFSDVGLLFPAEEMQMADSDDEDEAEGQDPAASLGAPLPAEGSLANNLLFCSDVPSEATDEMLGVLFQQ